MDVAQIGEHLIGRSHILVKVVEVGEQQLSPAVEMVERLIDARTRGKALVEFTDKQDRVGHLQVGMTAEEVADGDVGRTPERLSGEARKMLVEEERCTLVGEDNGYATEVGAIS